MNKFIYTISYILKKTCWQKRCHYDKSLTGIDFSTMLSNYFMAKANRNSSNNSGKKGPKKKTTRDIVKRHLNNKHDRITDEDFKNLSLEHPNEKTDQTIPITESKERPKDVEKDNTIATPWDVINE